MCPVSTGRQKNYVEIQAETQPEEIRQRKRKTILPGSEARIIQPHSTGPGKKDQWDRRESSEK